MIATIFSAATVSAAVPTISEVNTAHANGTFKQGESIDITIKYSEAVDTAGGTPSLALNSTGTANYASGTGTDTLTFNYSVAAGNNSPGLDYSATSDLSLNGATIKNAALEDADNTLPPVGTFAGAHNIIIDTAAPTIASIVSNATAAGTLKIGDTITFTLTPTAPENGVTVVGSYNGVALGWNTTDVGVTYTATYTVAEGQADHATALQITGVTIADATGNASAAADGTDVAKTIDAHKPVFSSASPADSAKINNATTSSAISYNLSENIASGTIVITRTAGADTVPTHTCTLAGTALNAGAHTINLSDTTNSCTVAQTLVDATTYSITFDATDAAGNAATQVSKTGIVFDTSLPTTTDNSSSASWGSSDVTITLSPTDAGSGVAATKYCIYDSGSTQCDASSGSSGTSVSVSCSSGSTCKKIVRYYSTDNVGNSEAQHDSNEIWIDRQAPSVSINSPSTSGRTATVSWSASDNNGSGVQLYFLNKGDSQIYSGADTSFQDPGLPDGTYSYKVKAKDNVGNESGFTSSVSATISSTAVISSTTIVSSNRSVWINLNISVAGFAKAGAVPITISGDEILEQGYQIRIKKVGARDFNNIASASSYNGKSVTTNYEFKNNDDGNWIINAIAWSGTGARAETEKTITVDTKAPGIELLAPKQNDLVSKTIDLKANATDTNSGVKQIAFYYRTGTKGDWQPVGVGTKTGSAWILSWNTTGLPDSGSQLKATAMDFAGNTVDKVVDIKVSNISGFGARGTATIEGEARFGFADSNIGAMVGTVLKAGLAEEASGTTRDANVSRTLKIIKIVDGNNTSYKASIFVSLKNNSKENVSWQVVEVVPKEFAQSADAIESDEPFSILENDPIIMWNLENIPVGKTIEIVYSIKSSLTKETAMLLLDSNVIEKFAAPPIIALSSKQLSKNDFTVSFSSMPTGFFGLLGNNWIAIVLGLLVAAIAATVLYFGRGRPGGSASLGAKPNDWTYNEPAHKGITEKISSALEDFIGTGGMQPGRKLVFKKDAGLGTEKKSNFSEMFKGLDFTIAKKQEKQSANGKAGKWTSLKNSDI